MGKFFSFIGDAFNKIVNTDFDKREDIETEIEKQVIAQVETLLLKEGTNVFIDYGSGDFIVENDSINVKIMVGVFKCNVIRDFGSSIDNAKFNGSAIDKIKTMVYQHTRDLFEDRYFNVQKRRLKLMGENVELEQVPEPTI